MTNMKRLYVIMAVVAAVLLASCSQYRYERVAGDTMKTRIYTLDNGLKVYMSVNREQPRLQTLISVRVGAKNDPAETTGLAHYFEHLMFKGTDKFGTQNYEAEKPLLDEIERLFELYRQTEDEAERKRIYAEIDRISQEASAYAIPNEYDKLMSAIGASGTNAWTSYDETTYMEEIPSNQIENWAKIESDRFKNAVIRGFHTELETVYEEYNMSLTRDNNKTIQKLLSLLMPAHPYGQHSVLGEQEHLKNPSITNIKNYYATYYVPNNMAICLSGDFNPDEVIAIIDKYFGDMQPNESLTSEPIGKIEPLAEPKSAEVYGLESEYVWLGWATGSAASEDALMLDIVSSILSNEKCGLLDVNINQQQKALYAYASGDQLSDAGVMVLLGAPKQGQTLEEVRELILAEVDKLRKGEFDEQLLGSIVANFKRDRMVNIEDNFNRAYMMALSFIQGQEWADVISTIDRASQLTKQDVVDWANRVLTENSLATVYKRQGEDKSQKKINKPTITPIAANRDAQSAFLGEIQATEPEPIEPVFVDFDKDMSIAKMKGDIEVLYKQNELNERFELTYLYDFGTESNPALALASDYFELLGTDEKTLAELQSDLYAIACNFSISPTRRNTYVTIDGIAENMPQAIELVENYMAQVKGDEAVLEELKRDRLKMRADNKASQRANFSALTTYVNYGADYVKRTTLSNDELNGLASEDLLGYIRGLSEYEHRVLYYGPESEKGIVQLLNKYHKVAAEPIAVEYKVVPRQKVVTPSVTFAQYDAKQIYYSQTTCGDNAFDFETDPAIQLYNEYFSGSMNAIVFQEMREARGLAYSASAYYGAGATAAEPCQYYAFIATQNDKMQQAIEAFDEIIENMPRSDAAFALAKSGLLANMATERTTKSDVLWGYVNMGYFGSTDDHVKRVYEGIQRLSLDDLVAFQQTYVKGRPYSYMILGDQKDVDLNYLRTLGEVKFVSQEEIFGY